MREQRDLAGERSVATDKTDLKLVREGPKKLIDTLKKDQRFLALFELRREFPQAGVYIVGGAVRDSLLGRAPKDIDFVVSGVPRDELESYLKKRGRLKLVGRQFGVYKFIPRVVSAGVSGARPPKASRVANPETIQPRLEIEIALPRTEKATGQGGYRDVVVQSDPRLPIEDDLKRRDFTINAMALDINTEQTIDPFDGQKDLQNKIVRAVGEPEARLSEDYSRMLRAIRFSSKFDFAIEAKTARAIKKLAPRINAKNKDGSFVVARELVGREFMWAFAFDPKKTIENLKKYDLLREVLPEVAALEKIEQYPAFHPEGNVYVHTLKMLENLPKDASLNLKLAVLWHDLGKALAVQILDLKTGKRRDVPDPVKFFASGKYDPQTMRVQNIGHAKESAMLARQMIKRLHLTQFGSSRIFRADFADIKYHLLLNIEDMRLTKAEAILFKEGRVRKDLLELAYLDVMNGDYDRLAAAQKTVKKLLAGQKSEAVGEALLPKALINGRDLIKLGFKPGPQFSQILADVREKQLAGELTTSTQAARYVQKRRASKEK